MYINNVTLKFTSTRSLIRKSWIWFSVGASISYQRKRLAGLFPFKRKFQVQQWVNCKFRATVYSYFDTIKRSTSPFLNFDLHYLQYSPDNLILANSHSPLNSHTCSGHNLLPLIKTCKVGSDNSHDFSTHLSCKLSGLHCT